MGRVVWKYVLQNGSKHTFMLPADARIVLFGQDGSNVRCMWVELDPSPGIPKTALTVQVCATGSDIADSATHIQSYVDKEGYVWHLYECV